MLRVADQRSRQEACSQAPAAASSSPPIHGAAQAPWPRPIEKICFRECFGIPDCHATRRAPLSQLQVPRRANRGWPWHFRLRQHFQTLFNGRQLSLGVGADFHLPRARPLNSGYGCSRGRVRRERAVAYEAEPSHENDKEEEGAPCEVAPAKR